MNDIVERAESCDQPGGVLVKNESLKLFEDKHKKPKFFIYFDININLIYIVIYIIISNIAYALNCKEIMKENNVLVFTFKNIENIFTSLVGMFISVGLKSLFLLIYHYQLKLNKRVNDEKNRKTYSYIGDFSETYKNNDTSEISNGSIDIIDLILIISASLFDYALMFIRFFYFWDYIHEKGELDPRPMFRDYFEGTKFYLTIVLIITMHFVFDFRFYKHQILSIIIISFGFVAYIFWSFFAHYDTSLRKYVYIFLKLIPYEILFGFQLIIEKWLIEKKFMSIYYIIGIEGIIELFFSLIFLIVLFIHSGFDIFKMKKNMNILVFLIDYFLIVLCSYWKFIILVKNDILQFLCAEVSSITSFFLVVTIVSLYIGEIIDTLAITFLLLVIGDLILSEIIVLNFCGFDKNTRKRIKYRTTVENLIYGLNELNDDSNSLNTSL